MKPLRAIGLSVAVLAGTGVPAVKSADLPAATKPAATTSSWFKRVFGNTKDTSARGVAPAATAPLTAEAMAQAIEAEQKAWQRRMDVCTELRRVALEKNDETLLRQIDELEQQAITLYNQRTNALGVKKMTAPAASAVLDHKLGTGAATNPLTAGDFPMPVDNTRTAQMRGGRR
jgi:hypothetical protein